MAETTFTGVTFPRKIFAMQVRIGPNWISAALTLIAGGVALNWPSAGTLLMIVGALILFAGVRVDGWHFSFHFVDWKRLWQVLIGLAAMAGLLYGASWYRATILIPNLDLTVFVDCKRSKLPDVVPPSSEVNTIGFGSPHASARHVGPARLAGIAGAKLTWLPEQQQEVHLCRIINQGTDPLFHLEMNFDVSTLLAMEKKGQPKQGTFSGPPIETFPWTLHLDQIGSRSQSNNSYDLYMWNDGPNIVQVNLPTTAKAQIAGQSEWRTFQLASPTLGGFFIGPNPKVKG